MIQDYYQPIKIYRITETTNPYGGVERSESLHLETTGLVNGRAKAEEFIADKYQVNEQFNFYTDTGQDIRQDDLVEFDGLKYRLVSNAKDTVKRGHHFKFTALRVDSYEL